MNVDPDASDEGPREKPRRALNPAWETWLDDAAEDRARPGEEDRLALVVSAMGFPSALELLPGEKLEAEGDTGTSGSCSGDAFVGDK